jgi:hypothetical protein
MTRRDDLDGDFVFIDFDSYHDLKTAFAFGVNAGGAKGDFLISNDGQTADETWDPVWWVKTSIGSNSWIAEMKIPFSQLRFDNSGDGVWGLNIGLTNNLTLDLSLNPDFGRPVDALISSGQLFGNRQVWKSMIWGIKPTNVFLVKFSYRLGR